MSFLKNTKYVKARISVFKNDRRIIDNDWSKDITLIYLTYFCRRLYILGTLSIAYSIINISRVNIYSLENASENMSFFFFLETHL